LHRRYAVAIGPQGEREGRKLVSGDRSSKIASPRLLQAAISAICLSNAFEKKQIEFERIIDKWIEGVARIIPKPGFLIQALELQILENGAWKSVYAAKSPGWKQAPKTTLTNALR
jgi:hypothetical protein